MSERANDPGPLPELAWLPVAKLTVDHAYQRTLESKRSQQLIERIAERFRWSAFQAVLAVKKGDGWVIVDGQHRVEAARKRGVAHVPGVVISAASLAEQAAAFVQANLDRVSVNAFALHHARLVAGDERALRVDAICRASGVSIPKYPIPADKLKPGQTLALTTIGRLAASLGEEDAAAVMTTIARAFASEIGAIKASIVTAVGKLCEGAASAARRPLLGNLAGWLGRQRAGDLVVKAVQRKHAYGGTEVTNLIEIIRRGVDGAAARPADRKEDDSFIKPPTREQLMGRR